jgi:hypothetical protein
MKTIYTDRSRIASNRIILGRYWDLMFWWVKHCVLQWQLSGDKYFIFHLVNATLLA